MFFILSALLRLPTLAPSPSAVYTSAAVSRRLVPLCFGLDSEKFTIMIVVIIVVDIQFGAIIAAFNDSPIL